MVIQSTAGQSEMTIQDIDGLLITSVGSALFLILIVMLVRFVIRGDLFLYYKTLLKSRQLMGWLTITIFLMADSR